jgi:hypothetical protein
LTRGRALYDLYDLYALYASMAVTTVETIVVVVRLDPNPNPNLNPNRFIKKFIVIDYYYFMCSNL